MYGLDGSRLLVLSSDVSNLFLEAVYKDVYINLFGRMLD